MEKLKLSLSKQHNKTLKIKSELLKIRKNAKIIKLEKISRKNIREFSESWKFGRFSRLREFLGIHENFFENFPFPGYLKIGEKGQP